MAYSSLPHRQLRKKENGEVSEVQKAVENWKEKTDQFVINKPIN